MKEVYLVMEASGDYDDYRQSHTGTVFLSLFSAEKAKKKIDEYYISETPFPFKWCDAETFRELDWDTLTEKDLDKYNKWMDEYYKKQDFRGCWIETLKVKE